MDNTKDNSGLRPAPVTAIDVYRKRDVQQSGRGKLKQENREVKECAYEQCQRPFETLQKNQKYCCDACRWNAWHLRKVQAALQASLSGIASSAAQNIAAIVRNPLPKQKLQAIDTVKPIEVIDTTPVKE